MAASDSHVGAAKQKLTQQAGDPSVGYITSTDVQEAFDNLQDGWQADDGTLYSPSGQIVVSDDNTTAQQIITNSDITKNALRLDRTATATSPTDSDIFQVRYGGTRATWANEKGNLRTSNEASPNEDALKVIGAETMGANYLAVTGYDATIHFRIGALGKTNVNSGMTCNNQRIEAVGTPTAASDAATKSYVDGRIWSGTQAAYDAIGTKDSTVLYVIVP